MAARRSKSKSKRKPAAKSQRRTPSPKMPEVAAKVPGPSEAQIQMTLVQHLRLRCRRGVVWFHPPMGELRDKRTGAKLKAMGAVAGVPDLVLIADGRTYGLEIKTSTGRVSKEQKAMLQAFDAAGAYSAVAHGLDSALEILAAWGILGSGRQQMAA